MLTHYPGNEAFKVTDTLLQVFKETKTKVSTSLLNMQRTT